MEGSKAIFVEFGLLDEAQSNLMQKYLFSQIENLEKHLLLINTFEGPKTLKTLEDMLQKNYQGLVVMRR